MSDLSVFEKIVYAAVIELINVSPDAELTYTKILTCYLSGKANELIPWSAIQKSKVYGKVPKANHINVLKACNRLTDLGLLSKIKVGSNYKYFKTSKSINFVSNEKLFSEKVSKYKKYLIEQFAKYISDFCSAIKPVEKENYYGFINKNPVHFNEYNWFWIVDEPQGSNSLKLLARYKPNLKGVALTLPLSYKTFDDTLDELIEILTAAKKEYNLVFDKTINRPVLLKPDSLSLNNPIIDDNKMVDLSFYDDYGDDDVFINDGGKDSIDASLSISESSPYKYCGDTLFSPKGIQKTVQSKSNFDFSFIGWKVVSWSALRDNHALIQNVLLVDKKTRKYWIILSLPKRKVLFITNKEFSIPNNGGSISTEMLLKLAFKKVKEL